MQSRYGLVVSLPGGLPATLPNTLARALSGAVLTGDYLVLPVVSIQFAFGDGRFVGTEALLRELISLGDGSVKLMDWDGQLRSLYTALYGHAL